ncbi:MAG: SCO family protein [Rickettsiales bacterium]|nr:SCO family protein [Rickettsiales bacterium]
MRYFLFICLGALLVVTTLQLWATQDRAVSEQVVDEAIGQSEVLIGGPFTLTDQNGQTVHESDFRGKLMLVFFGFTHCPEICPVTVKTLSDVMGMLGEKADQVAPIFITVDPARDTPEVMKAYLENFDKRFLGLTGAQEDITAVQAAYKAYAAKAVTESPEAEAGHEAHDHGAEADAKDYTMDHSAYVYLMDKEGKYHKIFSYTTPAAELAKAVEQALE